MIFVYIYTEKNFRCGNCKYGSDNDTVRLIFFWLNFVGT